MATKAECIQTPASTNESIISYIQLLIILSNWSTRLLRFSLALIFFWFGALKAVANSPVVEVLQNSFALFAKPPFLEFLGVAEILIGLGLIFDRFAKLAAFVMVLHLLGTLSIAIVSPSMLFALSFPILTMTGEFIAKNLVLASAGLVVIAEKNINGKEKATDKGKR